MLTTLTVAIILKPLFLTKGDKRLTTHSIVAIPLFLYNFKNYITHFIFIHSFIHIYGRLLIVTTPLSMSVIINYTGRLEISVEEKDWVCEYLLAVAFLCSSPARPAVI